MTSPIVSYARMVVLGAVHSNLYVSLATTAIAYVTMVLVRVDPQILPLAIVFVVSMFVYSFNRITDLEEDSANVPNRAAFTRRFGWPVLAVATLAYLGIVALAISRGLPMAEFTLLPLVVAVGYSLLGIKRLFLIKNLVVGGAWAAIPLGVGVYYGIVTSIDVIAIAAFVGVMITVAAALFDIKDIEGDQAAGIRTLPVVYGPAKTRQVAYAVTAGMTVVLLALVIAGVLPDRFLVFLAYLAYVFGYIPLATPDRGPLIYGGIIDGEHLFMAAVVLILEAVGFL